MEPAHAPHLVSLKLASFEGPLDLLLQLIEQERLPITQVAIGQVTEQYLQVLRAHEAGMRPDMLADFLVVAARLLWYKTKALFPTLAEDAEEEQDLASQLRVYQRFVEAAKGIQQLAHKGRVLFSRDRPLGFHEEVLFTPPARVHTETLHAYMRAVIEGLTPLIRHAKEVAKQTISLRDTITRVESFLRQGNAASFTQLLQNARSRTEIIVTFLAVLELVKQRTVRVRQEDMFGEMMVVTASQSAMMVSDERPLPSSLP